MGSLNLLTTNNIQDIIYLCSKYSQKEDDESYIGIDFGGYYLCFGAIYDHNLCILQNNNANWKTYAWVTYDEQHPMTGDAARGSYSMRNPKGTVYQIQKMLGRKFNDPVIQHYKQIWKFQVEETPENNLQVILQTQERNVKHSPEELASFLFKSPEKAIKHAAITVPSFFNQNQIEALKYSAELAGFQTIQFITEPNAIMISYIMKNIKQFEGSRNEESKNIIIYDFGGNSLKLSLVAIDQGKFEVKATSQDLFLGGENFDEIMADFCALQFEKKCGYKVFQNHRAMKRLKFSCERAKILLSTTQIATIEIDCLAEGLDFCQVIPRGLFEELIFDLIYKSIQLVKEFIQSNKIDTQTIHEVIMVGGISNIPLIHKLLSQLFENKVRVTKFNPSYSIVEGAAYYACALRAMKTLIPLNTEKDKTKLS